MCLGHSRNVRHIFCERLTCTRDRSGLICLRFSLHRIQFDYGARNIARGEPLGKTLGVTYWSLHFVCGHLQV